MPQTYPGHLVYQQNPHKERIPKRWYDARSSIPSM